jgi:hypothetical protein
VNNVAQALGTFFHAYLKKVGLMKIAKAHGFQNNLKLLIYDNLPMFINVF